MLDLRPCHAGGLFWGNVAASKKQKSGFLAKVSVSAFFLQQQQGASLAYVSTNSNT